MRSCMTYFQRRLSGRLTFFVLYVTAAVLLFVQLRPMLSFLASGQRLKGQDAGLSGLGVVSRDVLARRRAQGPSGGVGEGEALGDVGQVPWFNAPNCSVMGFIRGPDPTVDTAYDPELVCGDKSQDRDVFCSQFFQQIGLRDDGDCLRQVDDRKVPKIVYFVIFGNYKFHFWNYVAVMAAQRHVAPTALYVIGDAHPLGYWWKRTMRDCKGLRFLYRVKPLQIGGQKVKFKHHWSDLVRLQALLLNGGIYLDCDMVVTRPLDPILDHDITMGLVDNGTGMGNAFIAAKRNSPFIREWYDNYNQYNATQFYKNSLHVPRDMWHRGPGRLHMETKKLYNPNWYEADKLFKRWDFDWSQNYAVHVWTNGNPVPRSEDSIQTANTTIAQIFRNALYGDPRPREPTLLNRTRVEAV